MDALQALMDAIRADPSAARSKVSGTTVWGGGAFSSTQVRGFTVEADEPEAIGGSNRAPSPGTLVLAALGSCLTVGVVYNAALRGIRVDGLEITVDGDIDLRGFLPGATGEARPGFQEIRVSCRLWSDARPEEIRELFRYVQQTSPVADVIGNQVPVDISIEAAPR
ncbi:MAG: OsmC family protein [Methanomicrobiaceae archaeon]|nr:OsmC family protein [Methanomicrobiaceae archaeon]